MVSIERLVKIYNNFGDRENYRHCAVQMRCYLMTTSQ